METRARVSAWLVFISMAGTTMSFQVFHSIRVGHMPWILAVLYGIIPLLISMLLIDVVSGWDDAPKWIRWAAYLIISGAMYLSASATGAVVFRAAPAHSSLLFGLLLDGAAILAARYLMTAVRPAVPVPAVSTDSGTPPSAGDGTNLSTEGGTGSAADDSTGDGTGGAAGDESAADDAFGELLRAAREYRDELAVAGRGERLTKDRLRLRLGVSSGTALKVLRILKKEDQNGASESSGAVG